MSETSAKSRKGRHSVVDVARLQITLDADTSSRLDELTALGRYGRNRNEVASQIISEFLWNNIARFIDEYERNRAAVEAARDRRS